MGAYKGRSGSKLPPFRAKEEFNRLYSPELYYYQGGNIPKFMFQ